MFIKLKLGVEKINLEFHEFSNGELKNIGLTLPSYIFYDDCTKNDLESEKNLVLYLLNKDREQHKYMRLFDKYNVEIGEIVEKYFVCDIFENIYSYSPCLYENIEWFRDSYIVDDEKFNLDNFIKYLNTEYDKSYEGDEL